MKRFSLLILALALAATAMAYNFAGKTYRAVKENESDGRKAVITLTFTSASRGTMKSGGDVNASTLPFRYEVSGEVLNMYTNDGSCDYIYIDTHHEYGEDCLYLLDPYGNVFLVFERVATPAKSKGNSSGKSRGKRR